MHGSEMGEMKHTTLSVDRKSRVNIQNRISNQLRDRLVRQNSSASGLLPKASRKDHSSWTSQSNTSLGGKKSKAPSINKSSLHSFQKDNPEQLRSYQPTPQRRFSNEDARSLMKSIVDKRLGNVEYSSSCAAIARELSDSVKTAAKSLMYERYKLICFVAIGQIKDNDITCSSRGIWCPAADTFAEYTYKNESLFALCILYAVYQE